MILELLSSTLQMFKGKTMPVKIALNLVNRWMSHMQRDTSLKLISCFSKRGSNMVWGKGLYCLKWEDTALMVILVPGGGNVRLVKDLSAFFLLLLSHWCYFSLRKLNYCCFLVNMQNIKNFHLLLVMSIFIRFCALEMFKYEILLETWTYCLLSEPARSHWIICLI